MLFRHYLQLGLEVSRVYRAVLFEPLAVFERLGEEVQNVRREGDVDPSKKPKAEMIKLVGNSFYGK